MITSVDILNAKILVVDDKEANIQLIEGMLRIAGLLRSTRPSTRTRFAHFTVKTVTI